MAGLLRVTRPSLLTLGVINGNASLTTLYPHNTPNHCQRHNPDDHQKQNVQITLSGTFKRLANSTGQACYDPREDQQRDTIADALFRDLLTEPHHEYGAGYQRGYGHKEKGKSRVVRKARKADRHRQRLHECQRNRTVTRVLINLTTPGITLFLKLFQLR